MSRVVVRPCPEGSLIAAYVAKAGHYTDAFSVDVDRRVSLADYLAQFYRTPLFRAERFVLARFAGARSSDAEVDALAAGDGTRFAVWEVSVRRKTEVLLSETSGRTKSWLQVEPLPQGTRLWFGSVVVPKERGGRLTRGLLFDLLLGPHLLYSRALLKSAARRLA